MSTYYAILTAVGEAKLANATALGAKLQLSKMAVGDGNGALPNPVRTQTALVRETYRADLNTLSVDPANASQIIAELVIPETEGGYWLREMGIYDAAGDLFAIANCPPSYKPQMAEGSGRTQVLRMVLIVSSTAAVQLKIDPSVVLATRAYVDTAKAAAIAAAAQLIVVHMEDADPHPQYTTEADVKALVATGVSSAPQGLVVVASGTNSLIEISARELTVVNAAGEGQRLRHIALTLDLTAAGAGGLDTGVVAASVCYSVWVMLNAATSAVRAVAALCPVLAGNTTAGSAVVSGLASTASLRAGMPLAGGTFPAGTVIKSVDSPAQITATRQATATAAGVQLRFVYDPQLPNGYTHKARVSMAFTDASANKFPLGYSQSDSLVQPRVAAGSNVVGLPRPAIGVQGNISLPTWVQVSLANIVPPTCRAVGVVAREVTAGGAVIVAPNSNYGAHGSLTNPPTIDISSGTTANDNNTFALILLETLALFYASSDGSGFIAISCWEDRL